VTTLPRLQVDSRQVTEIAAAILAAAPATRCFKDPTRGGVATSLNEMARQAGKPAR
jgi:hydrogenase expression/formation protein HypE